MYVALCTLQNDPSNITAWSANGNRTEINIRNLTVNTDYIIQVLVVLGNVPRVSSRDKSLRASQPVVVRTSRRGKYQIHFSIVVTAGKSRRSEYVLDMNL